jgi:hypothetical protein
MIVSSLRWDDMAQVSIESSFLAVSFLREVRVAVCGSSVVVCLLLMASLQASQVGGRDARIVLVVFHVGLNRLSFALSLLVLVGNGAPKA